jgi:uncharacterized membrane protein
MTDWLEHSIQMDVEAPIDPVWNWWADLERMPQWMSWIDAVNVSPDDPMVSRWTLKFRIELARQTDKSCAAPNYSVGIDRWIG